MNRQPFFDSSLPTTMPAELPTVGWHGQAGAPRRTPRHNPFAHRDIDPQRLIQAARELRGVVPHVPQQPHAKPAARERPAETRSVVLWLAVACVLESATLAYLLVTLP